jgi:predicted RNase H-like HicB family nuclease
MIDYMKKVLQFHIYPSEEGGYVAEGVDLPVVTQGETLDELVKNIVEATELALEGENLEMLDIDPHPTISASIELETSLNAKT